MYFWTAMRSVLVCNRGKPRETHIWRKDEVLQGLNRWSCGRIIARGPVTRASFLVQSVSQSVSQSVKGEAQKKSIFLAIFWRPLIVSGALVLYKFNKITSQPNSLSPFVFCRVPELLISITVTVPFFHFGRFFLHCLFCSGSSWWKGNLVCRLKMMLLLFFLNPGEFNSNCRYRFS